MYMDIDKILLDLEIIKQLLPDDKLAVSQEKGETKLYVHHSSHFLPFKRWYYGYNRDVTIEYLDKLLDTIEKSSSVIINGQHIDLANLLKESINCSFNGFLNLQNTYINDSIINSKIICDLKLEYMKIKEVNKLFRMGRHFFLNKPNMFF